MPIPSLPEVIASLTAPGAPFEMEERFIRGIPVRVWKNAATDLRQMLEASRAHGDLPFLVYEDERLSYAEHLRRVAALARVLIGRFGVRKGDRVAIAMRNFPEWSVAFWAASSAGAVVVPLNAWMTGPELEYCLTDSGSSLLFLDEERMERLAPHLPGLCLKAAIVARAAGPVPDGVLRFEEVLGTVTADTALPDVPLDPEDDATIFYTSGTTGKPKGALGTHRSLCTNTWSGAYAQARWRLRRGEALPEPGTLPKKSYLLAVPFFHVTGCLAVLVPNLWSGNKIVLLRKWDTERAMQLIERERITGFGGVPSIPWQILESPLLGKYDLSSIESISYGGAPAAPELVAQLERKFPNASPGNGYGLTESSSIVCQNVGEDYRRKPESAGLIIPVCDTRIVAADGTDQPPGGVGELWIRGPNIAKGYWNKPAETEKTFGGGWLRTGDIARIDEEGFLYILDRAKDIVIRGGENVYCVEVEDALYSHPAVMDAAVVGIPHRTLGEEVGAVVQLTAGSRVSEAELKAHVAARLAAFKVPVRIVFSDEPLPRNANGKILKRQLAPFLVPAKPA